MGTLVVFLVVCQALGAVAGVVAVVWAELAYVRAMRDGALDRAERAHLNAIAQGLRFGMTLLLLASLGLVITAYALSTTPAPATTASYWTLVVAALLVIGISWALSRKMISFALGSALIFTGWWFLAALTLGQLPVFTFGAAIAVFVVSAAVFYGLLRYLRFLAAPLV